MDFPRCFVVNVSEYVWERMLPYMFKKSKKYHWITVTKNEPYKVATHTTLYVWWEGNKDFSATPLRSHMKRVKPRLVDLGWLG
jgi:hypothetical protein